MITESDARKFQTLFEQETGEKISLEEAFDCAEDLVKMIQLIYKPIKRENYEKCTSRETDI